MKTNTRYLFTICFGIIGIWSIKYFYFYIVDRKELDLVVSDYIKIGLFSGLFLSYLIFGFNVIAFVKASILGIAYGLLYNRAIFYYTNKKKNKARKLGIIL
jgi:hypothetical protein